MTASKRALDICGRCRVNGNRLFPDLIHYIANRIESVDIVEEYGVGSYGRIAKWRGGWRDASQQNAHNVYYGKFIALYPVRRCPGPEVQFSVVHGSQGAIYHGGVCL